MKRVVVTGAGGFVGRRLCSALAAKTPFEIIGTARRPTSSELFPCRIADLRDPAALREAFEGASTVVHCAAVSPGRVPTPTEVFRLGNIEGTKNVIDAAHLASVSHVVLVSTIAVYRIVGWGVLTEDAPLRSTTHISYDLSALTTNPRYSWSKAAAEAAARAACRTHGIALTVLRAGPIFGPGDHKFTPLYKRRRRWALAPTTRFPHLHVDDFAHAVTEAVRRTEARGKTFNLAGSSTSPYQMMRLAQPGCLTIPVPIPISILVDDGRARRELGFAPRCPEGAIQQEMRP